MKKLPAFLVAGAALLLLGAGCAPEAQAPAPQPQAAAPTPAPEPAKTTIKLGWLGPLTGDAASLGKDALAASKLAVDEVNKAGGINGQNLELIAEDGQCDPKAAANAGNKLVNVDKVPVILGGLCSGETMAVAPIAEQNKVIVFSGCSSAPTVSAAGDYIFRSYPSDSFQGKFAADYIYNKLEKKKVAVMATQGDWGKGVKDAFIENFKTLGGETLFAEDFSQESRDFRTQITKIKGLKPELVYIVGYTEASNALLKQAKEMNLNAALLGADAWDDEKIYSNSFAEGAMYVVPSVTSEDETWIAKLKAVGASNTTCAPRSYDNANILADIMKRVGTDTTKIKEELYKVKDYQGVGGTVTLDANGDPTTANYVVKVMKGGKSELVK